MLRFLGFVFLLTLTVGTWGKYAGWFSFSSSEHDGKSHFSVEFDRSEFDRDLDDYSARVHTAIAEIDDKLHELRSRSHKANAKSRQAIDGEIRELEETKSSASDSLRDLEHSGAEEREASRRKLDRILKEHEGAAPPKERAH